MGRQVSVSPWSASATELVAAEWIAAGYSQQKAADKAGVSLRTVQRYWTVPQFRQLVEDMRAELMATYDLKFAKIIATALEIEQMALGDKNLARDANARLAHDILSQTGYRIAAQHRGNGGAPESPEYASLPEQT